MEVRIRFDEGPLHGREAMTDCLSPVKAFFYDDGEKNVVAYSRKWELWYEHDHRLSARLKEHYDAAKAYYETEPCSLRFVEDEYTEE